MGLNYKIKITDKKLARRHMLSMEKLYPVDTHSDTAHFIINRQNDERVEVPFSSAEEYRPKY